MDDGGAQDSLTEDGSFTASAENNSFIASTEMNYNAVQNTPMEASNLQALHNLHARHSIMKKMLQKKKLELERVETPLFSPVLHTKKSVICGPREVDVFTRLYDHAKVIASRKAKLKEAIELEQSNEVIAQVPTSPPVRGSTLYEKSKLITQAKKNRIAEIEKQQTPSFTPELVSRRTPNSSIASGSITDRLYNKAYLDNREQRRESARAAIEIEGCTFTPRTLNKKRVSATGQPTWERLNSQAKMKSPSLYTDENDVLSFTPDLSLTQKKRNSLPPSSAVPAYERLHSAHKNNDKKLYHDEEFSFKPKMFTKSTPKKRIESSLASDNDIDEEQFLSDVKAQMEFLNIETNEDTLCANGDGVVSERNLPPSNLVLEMSTSDAVKKAPESKDTIQRATVDFPSVDDPEVMSLNVPDKVEDFIEIVEHNGPEHVSTDNEAMFAFDDIVGNEIAEKINIAMPQDQSERSIPLNA